MNKILIYLIMVLSLVGGVGAINDSKIGGYWTLNNTFVDYAAINIDAINNGATYSTSGKLGGAYDFDGVNDYIDTNYQFKTSSSFSVNLWFYNTATPSGTEMMSGVLTDGYNRYYVGVATSDRIQSVLETSSGTFSTNTANNIYTPNNWVMITLVYDGSNMITYVNGVNRASTGASGDVILNYDVPIGMYNNAGTPSSWFDGKMDEFGIWNRTLIPTEIIELYNSGAALHPSNFIIGIPTAPQGNATPIQTNLTNLEYYKTSSVQVRLNTSNQTNMSYIVNPFASNNEVLYLNFDNNVQDWKELQTIDAPLNITYSNGKFGKGYDFEFSNQIINVTDGTSLSLSNHATWVFWAKAREQGTQTILDKYGNTPYKELAIYFSSTDEISIRIGNGGSADTDSSVNNCGVTSLNTWEHYAITYDAGSIIYYKNGVQCDTDSNIYSTIADTSQILQIGGNYQGIFNGTFDELRIFNETLTDTQIEIIYNDSITSICSSCSDYNLSLDLSEGNNNISFLSIDTNGRSDTINSINIDLTNPIISSSSKREFDAYSVTWAELFNYSDKNVDSCVVQYNSTNQNCASYTFATNGNQSINVVVDDLAGNQINQSFQFLINPYWFIYFQDPATNSIENFSLNSIDYSNFASGQIYDFGLGDHILEFIKYGYAITNVSLNLTSSSQINQTTSIQVSRVDLSIYDVDTNILINQSVYVDIFGDSFAGSFFTNNGTLTIPNVTELPDTYELEISSNGYETASYFFTHTGYSSVSFDIYLQNDSTTIPIKYIVYDSLGTRITTGCLLELQIYKISSNSYEGFVMANTNSIGEAIFNLDTDERYKPILTCDGETQVYSGGKITSTPVSLIFNDVSLEIFADMPEISSAISYIDVSNSTGRFKFTYNDLNNIISEACLNVTEKSYTGETFLSQTCLSATTGSINIDFNKTDSLTYIALGSVTYDSNTYQVNSYYKKIFNVSADFGKFGILFALILVAGLAVGGFFMFKAKGVLLGATIGLWISSAQYIGVWDYSIFGALITWSVLLILGVIFL